MRHFVTFIALFGLLAGSAMAQLETEYVFAPTGLNFDDALPPGIQNGIRGLSGPFDMDQDGKVEILASQHSGAGGRIHVIENVGVNTWELVYSTALIDSSGSSNNARYATAGDLDGDGNWEIIYVAGNGYSAENPDWRLGAYIWEHDGVVGSDNYGTYPASIANFYDVDPALVGQTFTFVYSQVLEAKDVDGDGTQELLIPANGPSAADVFYVLSVNGTFEPGGAGSGFETWVVEHRVNPRDEGNAFGGGSPNEVHAADLDGDGNMELSFHSWNYFNFFNGKVVGADEYEMPAIDAENRFLQASFPEDDVALFGGLVLDIDEDGNDEIFYPNFFTGNVSVLDYGPEDDVLQISPDNFHFEAIPVGSAGGISSGDLDGDGKIELIIGGSGYSGALYNQGIPSRYVRTAEFQGGDPTDGANYEVTVYDTGSPIDTLGFNVVYRDSAGVETKYFETVLAKQGVFRPDADPIFPSGIVYLGDADGDGFREVAISFQGVDDSLMVVDEVWNADSLRYDRMMREAVAVDTRAFVRILSTPTSGTSTTDNRIILPSDYQLHANYPNPFNPSTTLSFTLPLDKAVTVRVYDLTGRVVRSLVSNQLYTKGMHEVVWNGLDDAGSPVASGTYLYALEYGNFRQTRKMVLLK